ncbi:MAG: histidine phosphatase family protein [Clostridia bacterium]|nr:histidine phosphatase family protein [Clostridia bacterium]
MEILIVRHGKTDWNIQKKLQGRVDIELNEIGKMQARETAQLLENENIDLIISSPLKRAIQTAEIINESRNIPVIIDERIAERNFGVYEGRDVTTFDFNEFWSFKYPKDFEGAETLDDFFERVYTFLDELKEKYKDKRILLVTHGGVSIPVNCYFNGIPDEDNIFFLCMNNCEVAKFKDE